MDCPYMSYPNGPNLSLLFVCSLKRFRYLILFERASFWTNFAALNQIAVNS